jgi:hypothetical protein
MNIGKIYIRPLNLITYRTFNTEYYSNLRKKMVENYNNKRKRVLIQKEPKRITNYGSFQNFDKTKWYPVDIVVEMKSLKIDADDTDDEWVDVKKIL